MEASKSTVSPSVGVRVLLVDDDCTCLKIVGRMLQICNYIVTECQKPKAALELLQKRKKDFDLVITDIRMPEMDGFELLEQIKIGIRLPVIMMSAHTEKETLMEGITKGACLYLVKPVQPYELVNLWQIVLAKKEEEKKEEEEEEEEEEKEERKMVVIEEVDEDSSTPEVKEEVGQNKVGLDEVGCASSANGKEIKRRFFSLKRKGREENEEGSSVEKKPRMLWTTELHEKFLTAINHIGLDRAVPKKILEYMKAPMLSRENVASHLQKYRQYLKKVDQLTQCAAEGIIPQHRIPCKSIFGPIPTPDMLHNAQQQPCLFPRFIGGPSMVPVQLGLHPSANLHNPYAAINRPCSISTQVLSFPGQPQRDGTALARLRYGHGQDLLMMDNLQGNYTNQVLIPTNNLQLQEPSLRQQTNNGYDQRPLGMPSMQRNNQGMGLIYGENGNGNFTAHMSSDAIQTAFQQPLAGVGIYGNENINPGQANRVGMLNTLDNNINSGQFSNSETFGATFQLPPANLYDDTTNGVQPKNVVAATEGLIGSTPMDPIGFPQDGLVGLTSTGGMVQPPSDINLTNNTSNDVGIGKTDQEKEMRQLLIQELTSSNFSYDTPELGALFGMIEPNHQVAPRAFYDPFQFDGEEEDVDAAIDELSRIEGESLSDVVRGFLANPSNNKEFCDADLEEYLQLNEDGDEGSSNAKDPEFDIANENQVQEE